MQLNRPLPVNPMRRTFPAYLSVLFVALTMPVTLNAMPHPAHPNYLTNTDLRDGFSCWHGDGNPAYLNPDGTEGAQGDKGVIPVIKIPLSKDEPRSVYQDYETRDDPTTQHIRVQVYASSDFKRSVFATDYSSEINWKPGGLWYWTAEEIPNVDFWIRGAPGFLYKLSNLAPGEWVTVDARFDSPPPGEDRTVAFYVPPGDGAVYIRRASVTP